MSGGATVPGPPPDPNLTINMRGEDSIVGDGESTYAADLALKLAALGEVGKLPDADAIGLGAGVDEAVGDGDGEDPAVLLEHRRDASVGTGVVVVVVVVLVVVEDDLGRRGGRVVEMTRRISYGGSAEARGRDGEV